MIQNRELSKNFTLHELLASETAERLGIEDQFKPSSKIVSNLEALTTQALQPIRNWISHPIRISSGYRCEELNALVGGSDTSYHPKGLAADMKIVGDSDDFMDFPSNYFLFHKIIEMSLAGELVFDQLIHEYGKPGDPAWIHLSIAEPEACPRRQVIITQRGGYRHVGLSELMDLNRRAREIAISA